MYEDVDDTIEGGGEREAKMEGRTTCRSLNCRMNFDPPPPPPTAPTRRTLSATSPLKYIRRGFGTR